MWSQHDPGSTRKALLYLATMTLVVLIVSAALAMGGTSTAAPRDQAAGHGAETAAAANDVASRQAAASTTPMMSYFITDLGAGLRPNEINNHGVVVGRNTSTGHPFIRQDGEASDIPSLGSDDDSAYAINDEGQVVGAAAVMIGEDRPVRGFSWQEGAKRSLPPVGGETYDGSSAFGINKSGRIVGSSSVGLLFGHWTFATHAVSWVGGAPMDLTPDVEWTWCAAKDINDAGQIVGFCQNEEGVFEAYMWGGGGGGSLFACGSFCAAEAINNRGEVVGVKDDTGFVWHNGIITSTSTLDGVPTVPLDINDAGIVVGEAWQFEGDTRAFLWREGALFDLNSLISPTLGWQLLSASAVNNRGQIVGYGIIDEEEHGFLLTPMPVVFVPGIGASVLVDRADSDELWPGLLDWDAHARLSLFPEDNPANTIAATDALRLVYKPLLDYLVQTGGYKEYELGGNPARLTLAGCDYEGQKEASPTLFVFPYDWRKDNREAARALRDYIQCVQKFHPGAQVNIVAHSMGGLVARRYILDNPGNHQVNALVTMGTPWLGAPKAIAIMETGDWLPPYIIWDSTTKHLMGSFTGAHQLLPSRAYYQLADQTILPIQEAGWDLDGNGSATDTYTYYHYIETMNGSRYARSSFSPGTATQAFHDFATSQGQQDNWLSDSTEVQYFHFVGVQPRNDTIGVAKFKQVCFLGLRWLCYHYIYLVPTMGDGTVPVLSAARVNNRGQSLNAPGASLIWVTGAKTEHSELPGNPRVQETVLRILSTGRPPDGLASAAADLPPPEPLYHLAIFGAESPIISDDQGNNTAPIPGTARERGQVPDVDAFVIGESANLVLLPTARAFTVTFRTTDAPLAVDLTTRNDLTVTQAIRYMDLELPVGVAVTLRFSPSGAEVLRFDNDGDGQPETPVPPTISVAGPTAQDTDPPTIAFSQAEGEGQVLVTITGLDQGSGVEAIYYSLDGSNYQVYVQPVRVNSAVTRFVYAFADDNLANRGSPERLELRQDAHRKLYLPMVLRH